MKWKEIFDTGIKMGQDSDIRNLDNPGSFREGYADSRIIYGNFGKEIKKVFIAVDVGVSEMLVVNELNKQGKNIDGIIMHHPTGAGSYELLQVVGIQKYNWVRNGIRAEKAKKVYEDMIRQEAISLKAGNYLAVENTAALLDIPVICMHTPVDNIVQAFFEGLVISKEYKNVNDIFDDVKKLPECAMASANGDGPYIIGDGKSRPGKTMVDMTGGIDPDSSIFPLMLKAGISTLVAMHYSVENIEAIRKNEINAVITGHMASDSVGLNIYCDKLEKMGVKLIYGPGLYRHKRPTGPGY